MVVFSLIIITRARRFNMWMRVSYFSLHSRMLLLILCAWVGVEGDNLDEGWMALGCVLNFVSFLVFL